MKSNIFSLLRILKIKKADLPIPPPPPTGKETGKSASTTKTLTHETLICFMIQRLDVFYRSRTRIAARTYIVERIDSQLMQVFLAYANLV